MSNFTFLKKKNGDFFKIISQAEKLFRDEYYEQVVMQTRRFAENVCKALLEGKITPEDTFDSMINKIKDNTFGDTRMQELVEDLFFIKKHGNSSAHSIDSNITPEIALECLERAYEISVFYAHIKHGFDEKIDKMLFSEELLMTGNKSPSKPSKPIKKPLQEKYEKELVKEKKKNNDSKPKNANKKASSPSKQKTKPKKKSKAKPKKRPLSLKTRILFGIVFILLTAFIYYKLQDSKLFHFILNLDLPSLLK